MTSENSGVCRMLTIQNERGLHARASAKFVTVAGEFDATITVSKDGVDVCGTSIMGLMMLAAAIGEKISVKVEGVQKNEALAALEELVNDRFGEEN